MRDQKNRDKAGFSNFGILLDMESDDLSITVSKLSQRKPNCQVSISVYA
jgi:hypothetical protein